MYRFWDEELFYVPFSVRKNAFCKNSLIKIKLCTAFVFLDKKFLSAIFLHSRCNCERQNFCVSGAIVTVRFFAFRYIAYIYKCT